MRDSFAEELITLISDDNRIMLLTGDLGFGVFDEIRERFPDNFLNIGVAEQNMTGVAAGLAMEGYKVFTYSIGNFSTLRCLEQIRNDASYHNLNINVVSVGGGFSYGQLGMSHHATEDITIMRSMPGVTVVVPGTLLEARKATRIIANSQGVSYLRIDKSHFDDEGIKNKEFKLGEARRITEGSDITLICCGGILDEAMKASKELKKKGISCRVVSMHTIKPIDKKEIRAASEDTKGIFTIEEHTIVGGLGGAVSEVCVSESLNPGFFRSIGLKDVFSSVVGDQQYLRKHYDMDSDYIVSQAVEILN